MLSRFNKIFIFTAGISAVIFSCSEISTGENISQKKNREIDSDTIFPETPEHFPEMQIPDDNFLTASRVELGEKLFFDVLLSKDSTISCVTCHKPELAFADTLKITPGINGKLGFRNAPSVMNIGYQKSFMLDGGVPTLEIQVVHPLTDTNEMGFGINEVVERLKKHPYYPQQSKKAYGRELDAYVITRALSAYERTLISTSEWDFFIAGTKDALTEEQRNGWKIFSEKLYCTSCHSGSLFTNFEFANNGSKTDYTGDNGRERITHKKEDSGKFKVPSLRNTGKTFPYMHDGSFPDLESVVEHYANGGSKHANQDERIQPFQLSKKEKSDLIQFLRVL